MRDRKFENAVGDGWIEVQFESLRKDDRFRAFEPDGIPVEGGTIFTALADAKEDGSIKIKEKEIK